MNDLEHNLHFWEIIAQANFTLFARENIVFVGYIICVGLSYINNDYGRD
jgi:hypothetical protein